jgi:rhodanese-related sulfurtransferase
VSIPGPDLLALIDGGKAPAILDVRTKWEFERGHVPGAMHVPFTAAAARLTKLPARRGAAIVVYCGLGPRAWIAGMALRRLGFEHVTYLKGHMRGWRQAGLREESSADAGP